MNDSCPYCKSNVKPGATACSSCGREVAVVQALQSDVDRLNRLIVSLGGDPAAEVVANESARTTMWVYLITCIAVSFVAFRADVNDFAGQNSEVLIYSVAFLAGGYLGSFYEKASLLTVIPFGLAQSLASVLFLAATSDASLSGIWQVRSMILNAGLLNAAFLMLGGIFGALVRYRSFVALREREFR